jgi:hypothetical protein
MTDRLFEVATGPRLSASWRNADGTQTIYTTADATLNQITIELVNGLGAPIALAAGPGTAVALEDLPPGEAALYLYLNDLIPDAAVASASLSAAGWTPSGVFHDPRTTYAYLGISPTAATTLDAAAKLELTLTGLAPASGRSGNVELLLAGTGLGAGQTKAKPFVNVGDPPKPGNQDLELVVGFAERDEVFTGGDQGPANELLLFLTNPGPAPLVPTGESAWDLKSPPTFQLDFVFEPDPATGSGQGALTDHDNGVNIDVELADDYGNGWQKVDKHTDGVFPYWTVQPDPTRPTGPDPNAPTTPLVPGTVLGHGQMASVVLRVKNIVTELPQGVTYAHLSYANIPGYNNGFFALELLKIDPIKIASFTASPPSPLPAAAEPTSVTLDFTVENASYVTIPGTECGQPTNSAYFTGSTSISIDATTTLTLIAVNYATGQLASQALTVAVAKPTFPVIVTGTVFVDPRTAAPTVGSCSIDPPFTVTQGPGSASYEITFPSSTFPGSTQPSMSIVQYGGSVFVTGLVGSAAPNASGEYVFNVSLTASLGSYTPGLASFMFTVSQPN